MDSKNNIKKVSDKEMSGMVDAFNNVVDVMNFSKDLNVDMKMSVLMKAIVMYAIMQEVSVEEIIKGFVITYYMESSNDDDGTLH